MKHTLKTHPAMFRACRDGAMSFQVRKDDRAFQTGDVVRLTYHDPNLPPFPAVPMPWVGADNREPLEFRITFVLRGGQYGIEPGYVVLGLAPFLDNEDIIKRLNAEFMRKSENPVTDNMGTMIIDIEAGTVTFSDNMARGTKII